MALDKDLAERVLAEIDRRELAQLGADLANIRSPTGQEKQVADFMIDWFRLNGLKAVRQDVEVDRPNAVGILEGDGTGLSLQFNGHTDTSFTGTEADARMLAGLESQDELAGRVAGDKVHGIGISNMKGGLASFMIAGKALKKSGIRLKGDVLFAGVAGEISRTPIGPWQTKEYRGEGVGTRHLLTHGMHTDYAVCCDGSDLNIVWTQLGVVQVKVTVLGDAQAAWGTRRAQYPSARHNAVVKMIKLIDAVEKWSERFEEEYIYQSPTGPVWPKVNIGAIEGGAPYRPNYFPGVCAIYIDIRMPPQLRPVIIQHELRQALNTTGEEYELEMYKSLLGYEGQNVRPLVQSAEAVHQYLFNTAIKPESPGRASIWTDTNIYNELGIPCIKIGPRGKRIGRKEEIEIDEMVRAAKIYALIALDICSRPRIQV